MISSINQNNFDSKQKKHQVYSQILSAAVINNHFRQKLLNNPMRAISDGYFGEDFIIKDDDMDKLSSIQATSIEDFATQLTYI